MEWTDELTPEAFPEPHRTLVETIGVQASIALMKQYGGTNYYVPKADRLLIQIRDKAIRKEHNGYNVKQLARKYGISQQHIGRILADTGIVSGQLSMMDMSPDSS